MRKLSLTSFTASAIHALRVLISCVVRFVSVRPRVILWKSVFIYHCCNFCSSGVATFCWRPERIITWPPLTEVTNLNKITFEIKWNANLMQQGNFIDVFLARHVSGAYAHHQEHQMLSCSIWFSPPSFWMGGRLESRCLGRVDGCRCMHSNQSSLNLCTGQPPICVMIPEAV